MGAHVLDLELQLLLGPLRRPLCHGSVCCRPTDWAGAACLEGQVLEEVRRAICLVGLCSGAGIDPHADRRGLRIGRELGRNL